MSNATKAAQVSNASNEAPTPVKAQSQSFWKDQKKRRILHPYLQNIITVVNFKFFLKIRLIWYFPEIKLSQIAEEVGYPADGQYFPRPSENRWECPFRVQRLYTKQA
mgnify:CR=1 FL=1